MLAARCDAIPTEAGRGGGIKLRQLLLLVDDWFAALTDIVLLVGALLTLPGLLGALPSRQVLQVQLQYRGRHEPPSAALMTARQPASLQALIRHRRWAAANGASP